MSVSLPDFDALWNYAKPAETEEKFREILPQARETGNTGYVGELLTQIARTQGLQRRFDDAHRTLDEVEGMLDDGEETRVTRVRYLLERGRALNSSGDPAAASPLFLEAWNLGREANADYHAVDAAHMLGIVEPEEKKLGWSLEALGAAERSEEPRARGWAGSLYNNIGWTHHESGDYPAALDMFEKALAFRQERGAEEPIRVARWCVARALRSLDRVPDALAAQEALEAEYAAAEAPSGYVHDELGECLLALGREEESRPHFRRAHEILSEDAWLVANEGERLERLRSLGDG